MTAALAGPAPAVDLDEKLRKFALESKDFFVAQRGNRAIFSRTESLQMSLAGVHCKMLHASTGDGVHECSHECVRVAIVDADAVFNADG